jgi:uncharacterized membrane protein YfcA
MHEPVQLFLIAAVGLTGGALGGLLGLGGSVFAIPMLTLLFGPNLHLFQSAALMANVLVATAATLRHRGRGTIRGDLVPPMAAAAGIASLAGVMAGNQFKPLWMTGLFGLFLCYVALFESLSLFRRQPDHPSPPVNASNTKTGITIGLVGGFAAGLLGIGGGALMVPMMRRFVKLPLREAVASSAAAMIAACAVGAIAKFSTITGCVDARGEPLTREAVLWLAAVLAPCAMLGGSLGAALVYRLPLGVIRATLALLLAFAGIRMISIGINALGS